MTTKSRSTTAPEPVPAGSPAPQPVETVPPSSPAPTPSAPDPSPAPPPAPEPTEDAALPRWPLSVGEAIAEVTRSIGAITKEGRSTEGYRFRGIDQALAALHPILGRVGLCILPGEVIREQWETRATAKGGTLNVARLLVSYIFVGPDGSELRGAAWGEGADSGDKATQKAHSQSYKTLVFQTFTIPTEESAEAEADATNPASRVFSAEEVQRAQTAWSAASAAPDLPALAGIRHRALQLLGVPVPMLNGTVIPLSVLFDQQRGVLEAQASQGDTGAGGSGGEQS
jgi:hypothetical protein